MTYVCPVCRYNELQHPPADFTICPSCGTEFELDDETRTYEQLRAAWIRGGARWFSETVTPPNGWREYRIDLLVNATISGDDTSVEIYASGRAVAPRELAVA